MVLVCDDDGPRSPDTLRNVLRGYLERSGMTSEEVDSLSLSELVARACPPPDPRLDRMAFRAMLYISIALVAAIASIIYALVCWLND